ncbi:MAG: DUF3152 domain-containing protein [Actinobacteria bacterium]|nr:DUF3152 domain-containing protein [Actinomycetota bacterium]
MRRPLSLLLTTAVLLLAGTAPAQAHGRFWDDDGDLHESNIEAVAEDGITAGCNELGDRFCPDVDVTRAQMARFLQRALDLPPAEEDHFADDDGTAHEDAINAVAAAEITRGCAADRFCPHEEVSRAQMASFIARAIDLPPSDSDHFTDDDGSQHEANIDALADEDITAGCDPDAARFCPGRAVHRDAMASLLARSLGLEAPDPTTGHERVVTYELGTEGAPDRGSFAIFSTRTHQALHGDGGWSIQGRLLFRYVEHGADVRLWLTDDDTVGDRHPVCSDDWSCTVGDDIYINDENFAEPPAHWSDRDVSEYQRYVINHEAGHFLDFDQRSHYNDPAWCAPDGSAPVMMQQSKPSVMDGSGCTTNVWPLGFERDCVEEAWLPDETDQTGECPQ